MEPLTRKIRNLVIDMAVDIERLKCLLDEGSMHVYDKELEAVLILLNRIERYPDIPVHKLSLREYIGKLTK